MNMMLNLAGFLGFGLFLAVAVITVIVVVAIVLSRRSKDADKPQEMSQPTQEVPIPAETAEVQEAEETAPKCSLGETIKQHRIRCGMTQEYVAETLNVSRQAVSKWETDSSDPSTSNLLALAKLFGISAAELLENIE